MRLPPVAADQEGVTTGRHLLAAVSASVALLAPAVAQAAPPLDPNFAQQWALARESTLGALTAWQQSTGSGSVVAVLDTGADMTHPDLEGALWTNPGEIPGNGIDDDHDGYVDDVHGADIVNNDGDPTDDEGHGSHVAGIIAARAGNGIGGAGLAPGAQLMIVKVLDSHRSGTAAGLATGIRYALAHGATIINTSVNGDGTSKPLQDALRQADAAGALVVASAGNDGRDIDQDPSYPASYSDPSIVSVASEGETGVLSSFSNYGAQSVDIAAPGENILSTAYDGDYELRSGTSMAAPFVSATLALMHSLQPELGGPALKAALLAGATPDANLGGDVASGSLSASGALRALTGGPAPTPLSLVVGAADHASRGAVLHWTLGGDSADVASLAVYVDGRRLPTAGIPDSVRVRARPGLHRLRVVAYDGEDQPIALTQADGTFRVRNADWRKVRAKTRAKHRVAHKR